MPKLADGRTRVYSTGSYIDVEIVVNGMWEGHSSVCLSSWEETKKHQIKTATLLSESVLGKGKARVDIDV